MSTTALPGLAEHPHARAVLSSALPPQGRPSHAYLFHGPAGTGKRATARAFAAELLAAGSADPQGVRERVARGTHPDLTWVTPSGAAEMLVADVEGPVVAAATRTPFESARRVFVIESVERMNDQAANRMLKTLEEPASFVHLVLLSERLQDVLATIVSRCQLVRFDRRPAAAIAQALQAAAPQDLAPERAQACARLAQGDAELAAWLAGAEGNALRERAEAFVHAAIAGEQAKRPWLKLLEGARAAGQSAAEEAKQAAAGQLELLPAKERRRHEREALEASRRVERRTRTQALDLALRLAELWLRDLLCLREGAPELVLACDRGEELEADAEGCAGGPLRQALELLADTRLSLSLNVSEELALEALAYRLQALLAGARIEG